MALRNPGKIHKRSINPRRPAENVEDDAPSFAEQLSQRARGSHAVRPGRLGPATEADAEENDFDDEGDIDEYDDDDEEEETETDVTSFKRPIPVAASKQRRRDAYATSTALCFLL
jgi:hypothetical protein